MKLLPAPAFLALSLGSTALNAEQAPAEAGGEDGDAGELDRPGGEHWTGVRIIEGGGGGREPFEAACLRKAATAGGEGRPGAAYVKDYQLPKTADFKKLSTRKECICTKYW